MKAIIMSCKDSDDWYADKIGKIYEIVDQDIHDFKVKTGDKNKPYGIVRKGDCQILR
jgi:hypothetical protein